MLNMMMHYLGQGLQHEPENLDINKVCLAKYRDIPSTHDELRFQAIRF